MDPDEELIDLSFGWRVFPRIIKHQLDHPLDGNDMIRLDFVIMPGLHDLRIGRGDIDLSKLEKKFIICPEDFHHSSPLIGDHF
jgi:hypothetical protein